MEERDQERFIRWQSITREQMGSLNNLIITLSVASLGFAVSMLIDPKFKIENEIEKNLFNWALWLFIISLMCGIWLGWNRLMDFRKTSHIIKVNDKEVKAVLKVELKEIGKMSWILLVAQLLSFGIGELFFALSIFMVFGDKIT